MSKEAMKLALEALEFEDMACRYEKEPTPEHIAKAITALRERLAQPDPVPYWHNEFLKHNTTSEQPAQPEQEPVAWLIWLHGPAGHFDHKQFAELEFERRNKEYPDPDRKLLPLYTSPPTLSLAQRQARSADTWVNATTWRGLTDEEIWAMDAYTMAITDQETRWLYRLARAIEAKLKEKNCG